MSAAFDKRTVLTQIDALLAEVERARAASPHDDYSGGLPEEEMRAITTRLMAAIVRLAPQGSVYFEQASEVTGNQGPMMQDLAGIILALRADIEAGYVDTLAELVHAEVFADFLGMADELQHKGYKDAAAVITGSVLEEHLRKLATKSSVAIAKPDGSPKKADTLNNELATSGTYNKLQQKSVTAWLDLRNNAAHGNYNAYDQAQVAALIRDIREFLIRLPA